MAFQLSGFLVEKVRAHGMDWIRPRHARRDITEGLFTTIAGYAALKRSKGLPDGKGTTLLADGSFEREFRDFMREALRLPDGLAGALVTELRDWTLKARGRRREYPWGDLFAENLWLWVIPKAPPLDSWATPRAEPVRALTPEEFMPKQLEILIRGPRGSGKSTFAHEIATHLSGLGFHAVVEDVEEKKQPDGVYALRLGSLRDAMKQKKQKLLIKAVQTPRAPVTRGSR